IKPGKPIAIGSIDQCKFFGLPGNPVSALVTLNLLVQPAMQKLSGMDQIQPIIVKGICESSLSKKPGRKDYQRGIAFRDPEGNWRVKSTGSQGSARITSVADGNCYIVLDEDAGNISAGDDVNIQFFDEIIL
ncbi:MAG: molybdopterin molybdenumtransferase MoeA, partial [Gammaproteobacteria bacterium]